MRRGVALHGEVGGITVESAAELEAPGLLVGGGEELADLVDQQLPVPAGKRRCG
ncbi:hypothetical protein RB628_28765 [Streptomyces sp. ADMS]|uniref:hypothetical protein n=1 Tax=Streptomyces sp. ADMS TaxID=3071415 RepID=UPI00296EAD55|nr:hypothetical protein [Streptomyces sp. ADMS]MDW4909225.1 hypothetical protein [Streptomyces sp. ADMS]